MRELLEVLERIEALHADDRRAALATVIATSGSTYRRPGARMLVADDEAVGAVSAGCLEDEIVARARTVIDEATPELIHFDTREEMDKVAGTGLGCRGTVDVFIEPLTPDGANTGNYRRLHQALMDETSCQFGLVTASDVPNLPAGRSVLRVDGSHVEDELFGAGWEANLNSLLSDGPTADGTLELPDGSVHIYAEEIAPPPRLLVFGAGFDAMPLAQLGRQMGFRVAVVDPRETYLTPERFPTADQLHRVHPQGIGDELTLNDAAYAVVMTHNYYHDLEILKRLLPSEVPYVGQIGPRERAQELLEDLSQDLGPLADETIEKLHGPVGLDLGAETPEEIALSVLSEVLAVHRGREAGFLRERHAPIHKH